MNRKNTLILIISILLLALIGGGTLWYLKTQKQEFTPSDDLGTINPSVTENEPEQIASSTESVDMSDWLTFDSAKDAGMKLHMSFKYPSLWVHKGSIDGGPISSVPFFDKEKYLEDCNKNDSIGEQCLIKGQIAYLYINNNEDTNAVDKGDNKHEVIINGYKGILSTNDSQLGIKNMEYISNNKIELALPDVNGYLVKFIMVLQTESDRFIFDKILETIKF